MAYLDRDGNPQVSEAQREQNECIMEAIYQLERIHAELNTLHKNKYLENDQIFQKMLNECYALASGCIESAYGNMSV